MGIASSTYTLGPVQKDGRTSCTERHISADGREFVVEYWLPAGGDPVAIMTARAAQLATALVDGDCAAAVFERPWDAPLVHATLADLSAWVRQQYRHAQRERLAMIARRILEWLANGRFTDLQLRTAFGLTNTQWNEVKTKMQTLVTSWSAIERAAGE